MAHCTEHLVTTTDDATATTHTVSGVTIAAGKLAVLRFGFQSDSVTITSVTDDAGNTWDVATSAHSVSGDSQTGAIAYLVVPAGGLSSATITITLSATATLASHLAYFDSDIGWPAQGIVLDAVAGTNTGLVTNWSSGNTPTTTQAEELLVCAAYSGSAINGGSSSASGSWTEENEQNLTHGYKLVTEWQEVAATGAYAGTGTWSAAEIAACVVATFRIGSSSTAPVTPASKGTWASGTTSCAPTYPTGIRAGHLIFVAVESSDSTTAAGTPSTPAGYTKIFEETQGAGATGVTTLTIFAKVADGTESGTLSISGIGNHGSANIFTVKNAKADAVTDIIVGTGGGGASSPSVPSVASRLAGELVVAILADTRDANWTTQFSAWANANLDSITEWEDHGTSSGAGGGIGVAYGSLTADGSTGATTATQASAGNWRGVHLIFQEPAAAGQSITLPVATETDAAQALGAKKQATLPVATSTQTAQALSVKHRHDVAPATESDAAQALTAKKLVTAPVSTEADAAQALTVQKRVTLPAAAETDAAQPLSAGQTQSFALPAAATTEQAQPLTIVRRITLPPAVATDAPVGLAVTKRASLAAASTADAAQALSVTQVGLQRVSLTPAAEVDGAQALAGRKLATLPAAVSTDTAQALTVQRRVTLPTATDTSTAQGLIYTRRLTLSPASTTDVAHALAIRTTPRLGAATLSDAATFSVALTDSPSASVELADTATSSATLADVATGSVGLDDVATGSVDLTEIPTGDQ